MSGWTAAALVFAGWYLGFAMGAVVFLWWRDVRNEKRHGRRMARRLAKGEV